MSRKPDRKRLASAMEVDIRAVASTQRHDANDELIRPRVIQQPTTQDQAVPYTLPLMRPTTPAFLAKPNDPALHVTNGASMPALQLSTALGPEALTPAPDAPAMEELSPAEISTALRNEADLAPFEQAVRDAACMARLEALKKDVSDLHTLATRNDAKLISKSETIVQDFVRFGQTFLEHEPGVVDADAFARVVKLGRYKHHGNARTPFVTLMRVCGPKEMSSSLRSKLASVAQWLFKEGVHADDVPAEFAKTTGVGKPQSGLDRILRRIREEAHTKRSNATDAAASLDETGAGVGAQLPPDELPARPRRDEAFDQLRGLVADNRVVLHTATSRVAVLSVNWVGSDLVLQI